MNIAADGLRKCGIKLDCEYLGNLRSLRNIISARKRLKKLAADYDLVHAQYGSACALTTTSVGNVPKVLSIRGSDWNLFNSSIGFNFFHSRLARLMTLSSINSYDCILTVSRRMAEDVKHWNSILLVLPMPSPIDLNRFVPIDKKEARALLGFPDNKEKWVLFNAVDLSVPVKRFALAKEVFELANQRLKNLRLRIATNLPHSELPLFTAACDVILCTSEAEGWPNCVKEALACNVPFVSTDVSDLRDIANQEITCRVCPADPVALADNICDVVSLPQPATLRKHVTFMSLDALSKQLVQIYESVLNGFKKNRR